MKRIVWKGVFAINALCITIMLMPDIANAQAANENVGTKLTSGRLESLAILIFGIASVIAGWRSMKRTHAGQATVNWKKGVGIALISGLISVILSGIHLAKTSGGFGTGGGKAGAIVAILAGATGIVFAAITFYRIRNKGKSI